MLQCWELGSRQARTGRAGTENAVTRTRFVAAHFDPKPLDAPSVRHQESPQALKDAQAATKRSALWANPGSKANPPRKLLHKGAGLPF